MRDSEQVTFGQLGVDRIDDTGSHTPPTGQRWVALNILGSDCVFTNLEASGLRVNGVAQTSGAITLEVGVHYGIFTKLKRASGGTVEAYCDRTEAGGGGNFSP